MLKIQKLFESKRGLNWICRTAVASSSAAAAVHCYSARIKWLQKGVKKEERICCCAGE